MKFKELMKVTNRGRTVVICDSSDKYVCIVSDVINNNYGKIPSEIAEAEVSKLNPIDIRGYDEGVDPGLFIAATINLSKNAIVKYLNEDLQEELTDDSEIQDDYRIPGLNDKINADHSSTSYSWDGKKTVKENFQYLFNGDIPDELLRNDVFLNALIKEVVKTAEDISGKAIKSDEEFANAAEDLMEGFFSGFDEEELFGDNLTSNEKFILRCLKKYGYGEE